MSISYNRLLVDIKYFITQTVKFWVFIIRCTQYEKPIPVPKDRFAFLFVLSQKKIGMINPQSIGMDVYNILNCVSKFL